jgi:FixJ family two-component response regulator
MPGMTGTELLSTLREDGSMLPVLVVSGQPIDDLDAPHAVFLPKPFEAAQLFEAVYGLLQSADRG